MHLCFSNHLICSNYFLGRFRNKSIHECANFCHSSSVKQLGFVSERKAVFGYWFMSQELKFSWRIVLATVIGFLGSAFGTVGGIGGGGIFVPMLTLIVGFDTKSAAALSKCITFFVFIFLFCFNLYAMLMGR